MCHCVWAVLMCVCEESLTFDPKKKGKESEKVATGVLSLALVMMRKVSARTCFPHIERRGVNNNDQVNKWIRNLVLELAVVLLGWRKHQQLVNRFKQERPGGCVYCYKGTITWTLFYHQRFYCYFLWWFYVVCFFLSYPVSATSWKKKKTFAHA